MVYFSSNFTGGIITSTSYLTNYFLNNFEVLFFTYGIGVGFGTGLITVISVAILPHYFIARLSFATGISFTGTAVGLFIFSGLNEFLVNEYSIQGAFLILSAISLNAIPIGLLLREPISISEGDGERELLIAKDIQQNEISGDKSESFLKNSDVCKGSTLSSIVKYLGLDLFRNRHFALIMLAHLLISIAHYVVPTMLPEHIVLLGGTTRQGANTMVIMGGANIFSRLVLGNLNSQNTKTLMMILAITSIISGASLMFSIFYKAYWMYVCLSIIFGLIRGIYLIDTILLTVKIAGKEKSHNAFGITYTMWGIGILIGLPSCGALANVTSSQFQYSIAFMCVGFTEILAGVLFTVMYATWREEAQDRTN